jgi:hypothetical protein
VSPRAGVDAYGEKNLLPLLGIESLFLYRPALIPVAVQTYGTPASVNIVLYIFLCFVIRAVYIFLYIFICGF